MLSQGCRGQCQCLEIHHLLLSYFFLQKTELVDGSLLVSRQKAKASESPSRERLGGGWHEVMPVCLLREGDLIAVALYVAMEKEVG